MLLSLQILLAVFGFGFIMQGFREKESERRRDGAFCFGMMMVLLLFCTLFE